jgi:FAD/FMN-containing dehydrogenase
MMEDSNEVVEFLSSLRRVVGSANVLTGDDAVPYLTDWRRYTTGSALAVVRPETTEEVAAVVRCCAKADWPIVPQGGNTGQVAAATPDKSGRAVVISLQRMRRIRAIDTDNDTMTVEAGCILQELQQAAQDADRLFPLSLGAEGSCTIGGNLATNAGGTQVLRYGNARELALGLEVVTPQGEIWNGLRGLRKDNTGYDLRDLYIGSEGTLGIITAAVLKLFPLPRASRTALIVTESLTKATEMLNVARAHLGPALTAFEVMSSACLRCVVDTYPQQHLPIEGPPDAWYALLELSDSEGEEHAQDRFEAVLSEAMDNGILLDAAVAMSQSQTEAFWHLRESITLALADTGYCVKHDISLPVSSIDTFVTQTDLALTQTFPGVRMMVFGHLGDGNLHYNLLLPTGIEASAVQTTEAAIQALVHDRVHHMGGSISAEQGVGQRRIADMLRYKDPIELALMQRIKQALDPQRIMNPGKVLPPNAP